MRILAYNPGHDGTAVLLEQNRLVFSIENEKDDSARYSPLSPSVLLQSLSLDGPPDVISISGYYKFTSLRNMETMSDPLTQVEAGYYKEGADGKTTGTMTLLGNKVHRFSSSHARSHIMCSYGLSPFPQGQPCYALIWEGELGAFYYIDENLNISKVGDVISAPGSKYVFLWALATGNPQGDAPGKIMALAAYGTPGAPTDRQRFVIDQIMPMNQSEIWKAAWTLPNSRLGQLEYYKVGVESQEFKDLAWQFSAALFESFYNFARKNLTPGLPLLIGGGCGLNCQWNSQWRDCGLFSDVFVPPCTNDSGVAIGAAIDALHHYTGTAKIEWSVYAGNHFVEDVTSSAHFNSRQLDLSEICRRLLEGQVIAWVQGRHEIGPRALGNRSLLAAPFSPEIRDKLNRIKQREPFRPVAPICLEEDFEDYFDHPGPSPHMLYFQNVKAKGLHAITHVDGSARAQSVNDSTNPQMSALLREFKRHSGVSMLCNTSLNFPGRGFVNRLSQLLALAQQRDIDGLVVGHKFWTPVHTRTNLASFQEPSPVMDSAEPIVPP